MCIWILPGRLDHINLGRPPVTKFWAMIENGMFVCQRVEGANNFASQA